MTSRTDKCLRVRCPKARRPTDPDHAVRDFPYPVPGNDFQALAEQIGNVCPCGARLVMLYDERREPWEEPMEELPPAPPEQPDSPKQPKQPAPVSEELEPLTPEQIGPLCDDSDPTIKLLARHLREQTSYLAECSDGLAYCQDVIKALAMLVVGRDPEALVMALDLIEHRAPELSVTSITNGWMGLSPSSWAVRLFALNFGRTLGDAPNCVEMRVSAWGKRMTVTIRREEGKSPMDLLTEAKAEIERLKAAAGE